MSAILSTMVRRVFRKSLVKVRGVHMHQHVYLSIVAIIIGILGGYGALLFRYAIKATQYIFYQNTRDFLTFANTLPFYLKIALPALGGLIVGPLVYFGAREAKGHGVPVVMEAVALRDGHIRPRVALVTILASGITIGSGGSVGREGPIVQIGSSIGSTIGQLLKAPPLRQRTLVGCGAAAGLAATFNAPIAGALFAAEVILGEFGLATFSPVVLSSVTATTISRHYFGDFPAFIIPTYKLVSLWEFLFYPVLGVIVGFVSLLFILTVNKSEDLFDALKMPEYLKPALGGLMLGCLLIVWPNVFGVGYGSINLSLTNQLPFIILLTLVFVKILATSITVGSGGSGGIFAPSLFIGAMTGGFFGWTVHESFPLITADSGAYAMVAMGALVAGTTHAPITAMIIIFELTSTYEIILPLMITCMLSTLITTSLKRDSIYTSKLARKGVEITQGWEQSVLRSLKVRDVASDQVVTVPEGMNLIDIVEMLKEENVSYLHMVGDDGRLKGIISFTDIRSALQEEGLEYLVIARDVATTNVITITPSDSIQDALYKMGRNGISHLPVVEEDDREKVIGTLNKKDVMDIYNRAVINREEM
ncbi:MAG: chloride channel protein [bacterium]|nr:chloride channel protein [bacterium]MDT8365787.1 chloride channel protein [bacterium]